MPAGGTPIAGWLNWGASNLERLWGCCICWKDAAGKLGDMLCPANQARPVSSFIMKIIIKSPSAVFPIAIKAVSTVHFFWTTAVVCSGLAGNRHDFKAHAMCGRRGSVAQLHLLIIIHPHALRGGHRWSLPCKTKSKQAHLARTFLGLPSPCPLATAPHGAPDSMAMAQVPLAVEWKRAALQEGAAAQLELGLHRILRLKVNAWVRNRGVKPAVQ